MCKFNLQTDPNHLNKFYSWPAVVFIQVVWIGLYFANLFNNNVYDKGNTVIDVPTTKESMEIVLNYLYSGRMEFKDSSFKEILDLLQLFKFLMMDLFSTLETYLINKIIEDEGFSFEKILLHASISESCNYEKVSNAILAYLHDHLEDISELPEVKYLSSSFLQKLIKYTKVVVNRQGDTTNENSNCDDAEDEEQVTDEENEPEDEENESRDEENESEDEDNESENEHKDEENKHEDDDEADENEEENLNENLNKKKGEQIYSFKIFVNWLKGNSDCEKEFKGKILKHFSLEGFTNKELITCVRSSSLYFETEILDTLSKNIRALEDEHMKLKEDYMYCSKRANDFQASAESLKKEIENAKMNNDKLKKTQLENEKMKDQIKTGKGFAKDFADYLCKLKGASKDLQNWVNRELYEYNFKR